MRVCDVTDMSKMFFGGEDRKDMAIFIKQYGITTFKGFYSENAWKTNNKKRHILTNQIKMSEDLQWEL